jgi:Flp pilus assembly protein TadD
LLLDLGKTLADATRWVEAEAQLRESGAANPRDPRGPFYLGLVFEQLGRKDDARAAFTRFIALAPSRYERQIALAKQRLDALR